MVIVNCSLIFFPGRISISDLSSTLSVSYNIVDDEVLQLLKSPDGCGIHRIQSELISNEFKTVLAQEIGEKLLRNGIVVASELAAEYQLPVEFILKVILFKLLCSLNHVHLKLCDVTVLHVHYLLFSFRLLAVIWFGASKQCVTLATQVCSTRINSCLGSWPGPVV